MKTIKAGEYVMYCGQQLYDEINLDIAKELRKTYNIDKIYSDEAIISFMESIDENELKK